MNVLAIDPGTERSAYVVFDTDEVASPLIESGMRQNEDMCQLLRSYAYADAVVIEMIASYGMAVGAEVFETCIWIGRMMESRRHAVCGYVVERMYRREVKLHLCNSVKAKDGNIRQALIDRFGGRERAIGKKASPGPLHGIAGDVWSALAVAVTYADREAK